MIDLFPQHPGWSLQTIRLLAEVAYGGADLFECFAAAERVKAGDVESWQREWIATAETVEALATEALAAGHGVSARQHFFRASGYFRQADFFLSGHDPRKREFFLRTQACFKEAAKLCAPAIEVVEVKCGDETYDGYFCHPKNPKPGKWPVVVQIGGADSLAEENFFFGGSELVERSVAVLLVDTPGRGSTLRLKNIYSRPDYEVPVKALVDYLVSRPEVDAERIGLVGASMGGYYAPRAAAFEPRFKAMVLWCGCYDILEDIYDFFPPIQPQIQWILGAADDAEARRKLADFNLREVASRISCPTLVSHGTDDFVMRKEGAERLYAELGSKDKTLKMWEGGGGAVHCNYDNWTVSIPYMMDWLIDRL